jgi:hypothetical protein
VKTPLDKSRLQERKGAKDWDGSVNSGSGNGWIRKGDVRNDKFLIEYKHTDSKSYSLKESELLKIENQALVDGRDAIFVVGFSGENWAVVREDVLREALLGVDS